MLTKDMRDDLYDSGINPIANIRGQIVVMGNRTAQVKLSALR
jgi:hypothetical protein